MTVQLPPDRKFPRLAIQWTATGPPLGILGSLVAPLPEPDLPLLARHWTAWLPPGYDSRCEDGSAPSLCGWKLNWSRRLFGPLGRADGRRPLRSLVGRRLDDAFWWNYAATTSR